jgi:hypothetical protein
MAKGKKRQKRESMKRKLARQRNRPGQNGDNSNYGRKHKYLESHGLWGWEVPMSKKIWRTK